MNFLHQPTVDYVIGKVLNVKITNPRIMESASLVETWTLHLFRVLQQFPAFKFVQQHKYNL